MICKFHKENHFTIVVNLELLKLLNFTHNKITLFQKFFFYNFRCVRVGEHEVDEKVCDEVAHARSLAQNDFKVKKINSQNIIYYKEDVFVKVKFTHTENFRPEE